LSCESVNPKSAAVKARGASSSIVIVLSAPAGASLTALTSWLKAIVPVD